MSLLQMSFSGGVMILLIAVIRAASLHRLPKGTFLALWIAAALRLLLPLSLPLPLSVYSLVERSQPVKMALEQLPTVSLPSPASQPALSLPSPASQPAAAVETVVQEIPSIHLSPWPILWIIGVVAAAGFFILSYLRCYREFRCSLPVDNPFASEWLRSHRLLRRLELRQSDRISSPLTYGIFHPVILLPKGIDWCDTDAMSYILAHEYVHIRRFDGLTKLVFTLAVCVHWFNPLVWMMYLLANRDIELSCDEAVIRQWGVCARPSYARTLISMEAAKSGFSPLYNSFSKTAIEERITAIMKLKKASLATTLAAVALVVGVTVVFATSAAEPDASLAEDSGPSATIQSELEYEELLREYTPYGISDQDGELYYQGEAIRYFLDGYEVDNGQDGYNIISRYTYYNASGTVDVHTIRQDVQNSDGSTTLFGPITGIVPYSQAEFDARVFDAPTRSASAEEGSGETTTVTAESFASTDGGGQSLEARFAAYQAYGISYEKTASGPGNVYWNGELLRYFLDAQPDGSVFSLQSSDGGEKAVCTQYDESGNLAGILELSEDQPLDDALLNAQLQADISAQWDETLAPYVPFGLTYQYDRGKGLDGYGLTMYYEGKEVRGIWDSHAGAWITEHTGNGAYSAGAIELCAIYEGGELSGLRPATQEEMEEWDAQRERSGPS